MKIERTCQNCAKSFLIERKDLYRSTTKRRTTNGRFCSIVCSSVKIGEERREKTRSRPPNTACAQCQKQFFRHPSKAAISKSGLQFCTRKCKELAQSIGGSLQILPEHYKNGLGTYRRKALRHYGAICAFCGYDRCLDSIDVHHIDENRNNNRLKNLIVLCKNHHGEVHAGLICVLVEP